MKILYFREVNKMLTKKKKIFILFGMVALLVVTGCLNLFLSKNDENIPTSSYESASFLTSYRSSKLETRQTMLNMYQSILDTATDPEQITETNALITDLGQRMERENTLEAMIMAAGFEDAVVTNADDGSYTVMVKSDGLDTDNIATILGIVVKETGASATNIKVSSV